MRFSLKHGAALAEVGDATLPELSARRSLQIGRTDVDAQAGRLSCTLDARRVALGEALQLEETTGAGTRLWSGSIFDVEQTVDRRLNQLRYRVRAEGPLRRLVSIEPGARVAQLQNISVDTAIVALLDAVGVAAAERDIGVSARILARWWLSTETQPWAALTQLVRTAGPRARLYEDQMGRIAFRDAALPMTPVRTLRGRLVAAAGDALVSRLERQTDGRERVVNVVELDVNVEPQPLAISRVAVFEDGVEGMTPATVAVTEADMTAAGVGNDDLVLAFYGSAIAGTGLTRNETLPQDLTTIDTSALIGPGLFFALMRAGWRRGPGDISYTSQISGSVTDQHVGLFVAVYRNAADPSVTAASRDQTNDASLAVPAVALTSDEVALTVVQADFHRIESGLLRNNRWAPSAAPTDFTQIDPNNDSDFVAAEAVNQASFPAAAAWTFPSADANVTARVRQSLTVLLTPASQTIWSDDEDLTIAVADGQRIIYPIVGSRPFAEVLQPVADANYTVSGSVAVSAELDGVRANWVLVGGAGGGSVTLLSLFGSFLNAGEVSVSAEDAGSIATYGRRPTAPGIWRYISESEGQDLADEIVAYSAHPRASWQVLLDGDRDGATMAACLESEIGDPVQTNLDAEFNHLGEVVGIDHRISGPATLLETRLTMLAAEVDAARCPPRLYLGQRSTTRSSSTT